MTQKTYVLTIIGENILLSDKLRSILGRSFRNVLSLGFATTRVVVAEDIQTAMELGIKDAHDSILQALPIPMANDATNPPTFRVDNVTLFDREEDYSGPRAGFTFFTDRKLREPPHGTNRSWRELLNILWSKILRSH